MGAVTLSVYGWCLYAEQCESAEYTFSNETSHTPLCVPLTHSFHIATLRWPTWWLKRDGTSAVQYNPTIGRWTTGVANRTGAILSVECSRLIDTVGLLL